jgi:hypothetical protein
LFSITLRVYKILSIFFLHKYIWCLCDANFVEASFLKNPRWRLELIDDFFIISHVEEWGPVYVKMDLKCSTYRPEDKLEKWRWIEVNFNLISWSWRNLCFLIKTVLFVCRQKLWFSLTTWVERSNFFCRISKTADSKTIDIDPKRKKDFRGSRLCNRVFLTVLG